MSKRTYKQLATICGDRGCDYCGRVLLSKHKKPVEQLYSFYQNVNGERVRLPGLFCSDACQTELLPTLLRIGRAAA